MSARKGFLGALGLALLAIGAQLPVRAQAMPSQEVVPVAGSVSANEQPLSNEFVVDRPAAAGTAELNFDEVEAATWSKPEAVSAQRLSTEGLTTAGLAPERLATERLATEGLSAVALPAEDRLIAADAVPAQLSQSTTEAAELTYPAAAEPAEVAQARRRTRGQVSRSADFIGIGADFGTTDDISFAAISKFSFSDQVSVRPSVLIGDGFAILVPVTYEFSRYTTNIEGFQIRPYAGVGASYVDQDDSSNVGLLLSGGVDVPISQRFTANAQANFAGVFSDDSNFGVTVGVGYNFGGFR